MKPFTKFLCLFIVITVWNLARNFAICIKSNSVKKFFLSKVFVSVIVLGSSQIAISQTISTTDNKKLHQKEDSLQILAKDLIVDTLTAGRMRSDSQFVRTLVRALQIKNSFYYPFDSIAGVSKLYAPDTSFRIFT